MVEQSKYYTTADPPACSCEGWKWRHLCRHVDELRRALELVEANAHKWEKREHEHPARDRS